MRQRVGLFGFGRTGRLVAREILRDPALELAWVVRRSWRDLGRTAGDILGLDSSGGRMMNLDGFRVAMAERSLEPVDVVIDFSGAQGVLAYERIAAASTRVVSAVSQYDETGLAALKRMSAGAAVLHSPNITVGINFLLVAARALRSVIPDADIEVLEEHFKQKAEVSGTAVRIAQALGLDAEQKVHSIRAGGIVGRHEVLFGMPYQTIRLVHESIDRAAFGRGAIFAARWLSGCAAGLYSMEDAVRASMSMAFLEA